MGSGTGAAALNHPSGLVRVEPPAARAVPTGLERVALLAELLVEFDPVLADEVRDHLEARAEHWTRVGDPSAPSVKAEAARRYQALADLIQSRGPMPALPRS
jgi:hypothetical protein